MSKDFNYFRIKMAYKGANDLGAIVPIKSEDLVMATCYTKSHISWLKEKMSLVM